MRAINHAVTGAIIGVASGNPWLAVPLSLGSHFALDAIPHHNFKPGPRSHGSHQFLLTLIIDLLACVLLVAVLAVWRPPNWQLAIVCAFVATLPDAMWFGTFVRARRGRPARQRANRWQRWHSRIQWFERPIGAVAEAVWLPGALVVLYALGR